MNNPNPLPPQNPLVEAKLQNRTRLKKAFFCVLAINIIPLALALLVPGCRKPAEADKDATQPLQPAMDTTNSPSVDTNIVGTAAATTTNVPPAVVSDPAPPAVVAQPPVVPTSAQEYAIAKGDSFSTLSKKFGVTVKAIQEANPSVQPKKLKIGQKIQIPASAPAVAGAAAAAVVKTAAPADAAAGGDPYVVKSGDNLSKIAKSLGVSVKALRSANSLTTDKIKVGQKLKIPAKSVAAPVESAPAPVNIPAAAPAPAAPGA